MRAAIFLSFLMIATVPTAAIATELRDDVLMQRLRRIAERRESRFCLVRLATPEEYRPQIKTLEAIRSYKNANNAVPCTVIDCWGIETPKLLYIKVVDKRVAGKVRAFVPFTKSTWLLSLKPMTKENMPQEAKGKFFEPVDVINETFIWEAPPESTRVSTFLSAAQKEWMKAAFSALRISYLEYLLKEKRAAR